MVRTLLWSCGQPWSWAGLQRWCVCRDSSSLWLVPLAPAAGIKLLFCINNSLVYLCHLCHPIYQGLGSCGKHLVISFKPRARFWFNPGSQLFTDLPLCTSEQRLWKLRPVFLVLRCLIVFTQKHLRCCIHLGRWDSGCSEKANNPRGCICEVLYSSYLSLTLRKSCGETSRDCKQGSKICLILFNVGQCSLHSLIHALGILLS